MTNRKPAETESIRTLIVGLGGTGTMAARWAKHYVKYLIDKEQLPPFIQFIGLDTDYQQQTGSVLPLEKDSEFAKIGDFSPQKLVRCKGQLGYEHLDWFPKWISPSQVHGGAHGVPHIGRLCYIHRRESHILPLFETKLRELFDPSMVFKSRRAGYPLSGSNLLYIHIIASICGGSGSGFLIDVAHDLRNLAQALSNYEPLLVAHLVLPEVFDTRRSFPAKKQHKRNAYCLLRHINALTKRSGDIVMHYRNEQTETWPKEEALFDSCYLINRNFGSEDKGIKKTQELIGRAIASMTLETTGPTVTEQWDNLKDAYLSSKDIRIYSSYCLDSYSQPNESEIRTIARCFLHKIAIAKMLSLIKDRKLQAPTPSTSTSAHTSATPASNQEDITAPSPLLTQAPFFNNPPNTVHDKLEEIGRELSAWRDQIEQNQTAIQTRYSARNFSFPQLRENFGNLEALLSMVESERNPILKAEIWERFRRQVTAYSENWKADARLARFGQTIDDWQQEINKINERKISDLKSKYERYLFEIVGLEYHNNNTEDSEIEHSILEVHASEIRRGESYGLTDILADNPFRQIVQNVVNTMQNTSFPNFEDVIDRIEREFSWVPRFKQAFDKLPLTSLFQDLNVHLVWDDTIKVEDPVPINVIQLPQTIQNVSYFPQDYQKRRPDQEVDVVIMKTLHGFCLQHLQNYGGGKVPISPNYYKTFMDYCTALDIHPTDFLLFSAKDAYGYDETTFWDIAPSNGNTQTPLSSQQNTSANPQKPQSSQQNTSNNP